MKEPISTITNLFYGVAGVSIIIAGGTAVSAYVGACFIVLMIGSGLFHGLGTSTGQAADEMAMYFVFTALLAHLYKYFDPTASEVLLIGTAFSASVMMAFLYRVLDSFIMIPALVLLLVSGIAVTVSIRWGVAIFLGYLFCIIVRTVGKWWGEGSVTDDLFHGIWHIATAATMYASWMLLQH